MLAGEERLMVAETGQRWHTRPFLKPLRVLPPRNSGRVLLLAGCVALLIPVILLLMFLLNGSRFVVEEAVPAMLVASAAGLIGIGLILLAARVLLTSVTQATQALGLARQGHDRPELPTDREGDYGQLLAETQYTLDYLEAVIKQLEVEATTDELTGMLNRRAGERRLRAALGTHKQGFRRLAVVLLDVDGLKTVNDRWGHAAGDAALAHLASALAEHVGDHGWVARWGGDEFLVVLEEPQSGERAEHILESVAREVGDTPLPVSEEGVAKLGISWGLSRPGPDDDNAAVVSRADAALYRAKQHSRSVTEPVSLPTP
jgi:diguanylate cyclase (GGDEF)-like protein